MADAKAKGKFVANIGIYNATRQIPEEIINGIIEDYLNGGMYQREIAAKYNISLTKVNKTITKYRNTHHEQAQFF